MKKLVFLLPLFLFVFGCVVVVGNGGCYHLKKKDFDIQDEARFIVKEPITLEVKTRGFITTVYVVQSKSDELRVKTRVKATAYTNFDDFKVKVKQNKGAIVVYSVFKPEQKAISICNIRGISEIRIEVPLSVERLIYHTTSTDFDCEGVKAETIKIDATSGDVSLTKCRATTIKIKATSGDISINNTEGENANIRLTSGDLDVGNCKFGNFSASATSGDISFHSFNEFERCEVYTTSGSFDSDDGIKFGKASITATSGDISLRLKVFNSVNIHTTSGDVEVSLDKINDIHIYAKTNSGDFHIGFPLPDGVSIKDNMLEVGKGKNTELRIFTTSGDISLSAF